MTSSRASPRRGRMLVVLAAVLVAVVVLGLALVIGSRAGREDATSGEPGSGPAVTSEVLRTPGEDPTASQTTSDSVEESAEPTPTPDAGSARAALAALQVAPQQTGAPYDRDLFEYRAYDHDRNGCDIRNDVLRRDLDEVVIRPSTNGCVVETGTLADPYTGAVLAFERGADTSADVQIDHVVSMANAWRTGAQGWDSQTLREFGNDPLNLLAVDGPTNQSKSDSDASDWLPPAEGFWCEFVARQVAVKTAYDLTVTSAEQQAMADVLQACPDQPVLTSAATATP